MPAVWGRRVEDNEPWLVWTSVPITHCSRRRVRGSQFARTRPWGAPVEPGPLCVCVCVYVCMCMYMYLYM